ncbi:hypothetical protein [Bacillus toyonensis]|uniref:hypothetical protein n=1 Tax=Bacillus toyonensis TaxID=155322 RepID=UPI002175F842|nr:hypothetical protein [Bacillus toyonensis]
MNKLRELYKIFVLFFILYMILLIFSPSRIVGRSAIQKDDLKLQVNRQATTGTSQKISKSDLATLNETSRENTVAVLKVSYWNMTMFQYIFYENSIVPKIGNILLEFIKNIWGEIKIFILFFILLYYFCTFV